MRPLPQLGGHEEAEGQGEQVPAVDEFSRGARRQVGQESVQNQEGAALLAADSQGPADSENTGRGGRHARSPPTRQQRKGLGQEEKHHVGLR